MPRYTLIAVLLLGTGIFLHNLAGYQPLWVDEGWSIAAAQQSTLVSTTEFVAADVHPPLYFQALHTWEYVAGDSIFALRYFSVLISLVTVVLVARLGADLVGWQAGLLAALLFVLHDLALVLGQEVRQYPLAILLAALVLVCYVRKSDAGVILAGTALLYTNYWGGFLLLVLGLHRIVEYLYIRRVTYRSPLNTSTSLIRHVRPFAAIALLFTPWVPVVLGQVGGEAVGGLGHALPTDWDGLKILAFQLLGRPEIFWLLLLGVGVVGAVRMRVRSNGMLLALAIALPVGLSLVINLALPTLSFRALSMLIPAIVVLIALGIASFRPYERGVLVLTVLALTVTLPAAQPAVRIDWPTVAAFLADHSTAADVVLIETDFDTYALDYYLDQRHPALDVIFSEVERRRTFETIAAFEADLSASIDDYTGLWVARFSSDYDLLPTLAAHGWQQTAALAFPTTGPLDVEVFRYDRPPEPPPVAQFGEVMTLAHAEQSTHSETVTVNLLWEAATVPERAYTISAFLLDADGLLVAQNDQPPLNGRTPTTNWATDRPYFDSHALDVSTLATGTYTVGVKVYTFTDASFSEIDVQLPDDGGDDDYVTLGTVQVGG